MIFKWALFVIGLLVTIIATPLLVSFSLNELMCWSEPLVGSISAFIVVFYSYLFSPKFKIVCSIVGFLLGAVVASVAPEINWYPECHKLAYEKTYIPLLATYFSGLLTLTYCIYLSKRI